MTSQRPNIQTREGQEQLRRMGIKPIPQPDELTRPYWEAARKRELRLQRCAACGEFRHPPAHSCATCGSLQYQWSAVSGRGTVYSFIIDYRLMVPGFDEPYVVAQINPVEAQKDTVRLTANIRGCQPDDVYIGMPVEVIFEERGGIVLPQFRPSAAANLPSRASPSPSRG